MTVAGLAGLLCCVVLAAWSLVVRSRRGTDTTRQQIRWLAYSGCLVAVALVPAVALSLTPGTPERVASGAAEAAALTIPAAVTVAVLRYRLYDLDIVVRKTVVAGVVAAVFTGIYVLVVVGVGAVTGHAGSGALAYAAAALAAVALQPVRVRSGRLADRLVYGRRATPYEVLSEFTERAADTYSTDQVLPAIARMLTAATGARRAEVWMQVGGQARPAAVWPAASPDGRLLPEPADPASRDPATRNGDTREFAVEHQAEQLGSLRLTFDRREPLTPGGERLARNVAAQAGLVMRNVRLVEDLRASRQRIVATADQERQRIERDLHDGAQQQLVALRINLRLARQAVRTAPAEADELLEQTEQAAASALDQLRDLAHGIYPPILADLGLPAALQAQARKAALPVTIEAAAVGRYPQQAEAAVYFSVLEALQNAAKYARASAARVTLSRDGAGLVFTVEDGGTGFDPATTPMGTGLHGIADRLAALGGTVDISSRPGHGTRISGRLPAAALGAGGKPRHVQAADLPHLAESSLHARSG